MHYPPGCRGLDLLSYPCPERYTLSRTSHETDQSIVRSMLSRLEGITSVPVSKRACLKAAHLRWTGCSVFNGAPTHNLPHCGVHRQLFGVVNILIPGQSAKDALPK